MIIRFAVAFYSILHFNIKMQYKYISLQLKKCKRLIQRELAFSSGCQSATLLLTFSTIFFMAFSDSLSRLPVISLASL